MTFGLLLSILPLTILDLQGSADHGHFESVSLEGTESITGSVRDIGSQASVFGIDQEISNVNGGEARIMMNPSLRNVAGSRESFIVTKGIRDTTDTNVSILKRGDIDLDFTLDSLQYLIPEGAVMRHFMGQKRSSENFNAPKKGGGRRRNHGFRNDEVNDHAEDTNDLIRINRVAINDGMKGDPSLIVTKDLSTASSRPSSDCTVRQHKRGDTILGRKPQVCLELKAEDPVLEGNSARYWVKMSEVLSTDVTVSVKLMQNTVTSRCSAPCEIATNEFTLKAGTITTLLRSVTFLVHLDPGNHPYENYSIELDVDDLPSEVSKGEPSSISFRGKRRPAVTLPSNGIQVVEGEDVKVTVALSYALSGDVEIPVTLSHGNDIKAAEDTDYGSLKYIEILGGETSGTGTISTITDGDSDDEVFKVALGALPKAVRAEKPKEVTVKILEARTANFTASPDPVLEGNDVTVTATISKAFTDHDVTIPFTLDDKNSRSYEIINPKARLEVTIRQGETSGTGTIATRGDTNLDNEKFSITLDASTLPVAVIAGTPPLEVTIKDKGKPTVMLSASPTMVVEGNFVTVTVTLSKALSKNVDIPISLAGTGTAPATVRSDFSELKSGNTKITIPAGEAFATDEVLVIRDTEVEGDEQFRIEYHSLPDNVRDSDHTDDQFEIITIENMPVVNLSASPDLVVEDLDITVFARILGERPSGVIRVPVRSSHGCVTCSAETTDYEETIKVISIPETENEGHVLFSTHRDKDEDDEIFMVSIEENGLTGTVIPGEHAARLVTIRDSDRRIWRFDDLNVSVLEGESTKFKVWLSERPVSNQMAMINVPASSNLMVTPPRKDPNAHILFSPQNWETKQEIKLEAGEDDHNFADETVVLRLSTRESSSTTTVDYDVNVTIIDNDKIAVSETEVTVTEELESKNAFTVKLEEAPTRNVTVTISSDGSDLRWSGDDLTFTPQNYKEGKIVNLLAVDDDDGIGDETETITLSPSGAPEYSGRTKTIKVTIKDNDLTPKVAFDPTLNTITEGDVLQHHVVVKVDPVSATNFMLKYAVDDASTATRGAEDDYTIPADMTVEVVAGQNSAQIPVEINDDHEDEHDETIILTLKDGTGYIMGGEDKYTLTIRDNDTPAIQFDLDSDRVNEDIGNHGVPVKISPVPVEDFSLSYTVGNRSTATKGADGDYMTPGTIKVEAREGSVNIPVEIKDDVDYELDETIILTLSDGTDYKVGHRKTHTLTINDNDQPEVQFSYKDSKRGENRDTQIQVRLSDFLKEDITLTYSLKGSATEGEDFRIMGNSGELPIRVLGRGNMGFINIRLLDDKKVEGPETIILMLTDGKGYRVGNRNTHTLTIVDDDTLVLPEFGFASGVGTEGEADITYNVGVNINPAPTIPIRLSYNVANGSTATRGANDDYMTPGTVDVKAKANYVEIPVIIKDDPEDEIDETVILTLTPDDTKYTVSSTANTHTLTITDNDTPEVSFALASESVDEDVVIYNVKVNINPVPAAIFTLKYNLDPNGTADEGTDYSITGSGSISVDPGVSSANIPVKITDDNEDENPETVILTLTPDDTKYTVSSTANTHTLTITDNDTPEVSFALPSESVDEDVVIYNVKVNINPVPAAIFTLKYNLDPNGTADEGTDYSITGSGSISVDPGVPSANIPVKITDDNEDENPETVILTLTPDDTKYTVSSIANQHTLTIMDNDIPEVGFASSSSSSGEGNDTPHAIRVNINPASVTALTITYSLRGDAKLGADYSIANTGGSISVDPGVPSANIPVTITDDNETETDEAVILTLMPDGTKYTVSSAANEHTLTIVDNDDIAALPKAFFASSSGSVGESAGMYNADVYLSAAVPADGLTLKYTLEGDAVRNIDYISSGSVFVSAGSESAKIPVRILNDNEVESNEQIILTLIKDAGYDVGTGSNHTLTIKDNDALPEVAFSSASTSVNEDIGTRNVTINITPASEKGFTLNYGLDGSAERGTDYTSSGTVAVVANAVTVNIPVAVTDDNVEETAETIILILESGLGYVVGDANKFTLTIMDNDHISEIPASVSISATPTSVIEGESIEITATLSRVLPVQIAIPLKDTPGPPDPAELNDYDPLQSITIPAGALTASGDIITIDDTIAEADETFTVALGESLPSGIVAGSPSSVELTIIDDADPPPPVQVTLSVDPKEVDEGDPVKVTVTLSKELDDAVVIPLDFRLGTAELGDYTEIERIIIPGGRTEASEEIQTFRDSDTDDEIFWVVFSRLLPPEVDPGSETSQAITIRDIFPPKEVSVQFLTATQSVNEGENANVTVVLSDVRPNDIMIPLTLTSGSADMQDYQTTPVQIEIETGKRRGATEISIIQDDLVEPSETFSVEFGELLPPGITKGIPAQMVVTILNDDESGIVAQPSSISVLEAESASIRLSLMSKPSDDVRITVTLSTDSDLTVTPFVLIFTPDKWDQEQEVILNAADDPDSNDEEEILTFIASGGGYAGIAETVSVTIIDNDAKGINAPVLITIDENASETFNIALVTAPSDEVMVTVPSPVGDLTAMPTRLTFNPNNWAVPQPVTLWAASDDDFLDDHAMLTLTAIGGGYAGVTRIVDVQVRDIDDAGIDALDEVTMIEGDAVPLPVRLLAAPSGHVEIRFTGHIGTQLVLDKSLLTFTQANWNIFQTVTLTATEDNEDAEENRVDLVLTASGGGYDEITPHLTQIIITDNDQPELPLTIGIYDDRKSEGEGRLQLAIELSRTAEETVTVQYATSDVEAREGLDYTASRGVVVFDPGATRGVIEIAIIEDDLPEASERFTVTLSDAINATIARGAGTGTIMDNDGNAKLRIDDALVMEEDGSVQFHVSLSNPQREMVTVEYQTQDGTAKAGEDYEATSGILNLAPGIIEAVITVSILKDDLDWREETFSIHLMSSKHAEIEKAVGVATIQESTTASEKVLEAYAARFVRTASVQVVDALGGRFRQVADGAVCAASERTETAQLWYSASSWDPSLGELLAGCSMSQSMSLFSGSFGVWGQGAFRQFNGQREDELTLRGEVTTGMLGMDHRWKGGWLAGVLFAHSQGDGSFDVKENSGDVTSALTGIYPYVSYTRAGWEVWASAGAGRGSAKVSELKGDLTSRFGALGMRGSLASGGATRLSYHGDILVTDAEIEEHNIMTDVYRIRAGLEASAKITVEIRPYVEVNVRQDGGSAETGTGLELGGGVRFANPAWRLRGEVRTQGLVMHTAGGFTEWGFSGSMQMGSSTEGLMMLVRPSWGRGRGMSMYRQQTILDVVSMGRNMHRTELELGYGIPWKDGAARSVVGMTQLPQGMTYRLGGELRPRDWLSFSVYGLAHGREAVLGDIGVNVQGMLQY